MRYTFLPSTEQKRLKSGYRVHAIIVALFMMSIAGLVGVISLFPSYVLVSTERALRDDTLASIQKGDVSGNGTIRQELVTDADRLSLFTKDSSIRPSQLIEDTISARGTVRILAISVEHVSTTTVSIVVQGIAPTRESLVAYKIRLENMATGNKVDLPISELTKSTDIQFSFKYTVVTP